MSAPLGFVGAMFISGNMAELVILWLLRMSVDLVMNQPEKLLRLAKELPSGKLGIELLLKQEYRALNHLVTRVARADIMDAQTSSFSPRHHSMEL
jgi:hypothetical protein